jgi:aspartyl-tRNA(Asn)/glutamyl-tRNA(Gln) amidotransferase subunit C
MSVIILKNTGLREIMKLSREEVLHIALLARVGVTESDIDKVREQLSNILENFEVLNKVDTSNVLPTAQSLSLQNVIKDDVVQPSMTQEEVLANAPQREDDYIKIKAVLE